jgi:hypothetical protein
MTRLLRQPSILILLAANLAPLAGVMLWHWDAFILLMLYWLETAVVAFWTLVRIATMPRDALGGIRFEGSDKPAAPLALAAFFTLHAGIFMAVHFLFLWELFSGDWAQQVHGVRDFVVEIVIATALWVPLVGLFIARGASVTFELTEPTLRRALRLAPRKKEISTLSPAETVLFGLYVRIFVMQLTIILGAWIAIMTGTVIAYVFLVAIKTAIDLALQVFADELNTAWVRAKARAKDPAQAE